MRSRFVMYDDDIDWVDDPLALASWDEEDHPRDTDGKFTEGPDANVGPQKKQKSAPATKAQIEQIIAMKKGGASYAQIMAATGINPKQAATIVFKVNKAQKEIKEKIAAKEAATGVVAGATVKQSEAGLWEVFDANGNLVNAYETEAQAQAAKAEFGEIASDVQTEQAIDVVDKASGGLDAINAELMAEGKHVHVYDPKSGLWDVKSPNGETTSSFYEEHEAIAQSQLMNMPATSADMVGKYVTAWDETAGKWDVLDPEGGIVNSYSNKSTALAEVADLNAPAPKAPGEHVVDYDLADGGKYNVLNSDGKIVSSHDTKAAAVQAALVADGAVAAPKDNFETDGVHPSPAGGFEVVSGGEIMGIFATKEMAQAALDEVDETMALDKATSNLYHGGLNSTTGKYEVTSPSGNLVGTYGTQAEMEDAVQVANAITPHVPAPTEHYVEKGADGLYYVKGPNAVVGKGQGYTKQKAALDVAQFHNDKQAQAAAKAPKETFTVAQTGWGSWQVLKSNGTVESNHALEGEAVAEQAALQAKELLKVTDPKAFAAQEAAELAAAQATIAKQNAASAKYKQMIALVPTKGTGKITKKKAALAAYNASKPTYNELQKAQKIVAKAGVTATPATSPPPTAKPVPLTGIMAKLAGPSWSQPAGGQYSVFDEKTKSITVQPPLGVNAKQEVYEWKEKQVDPGKGKYAYFLGDVQVSSAKLKEDHEGSAKTIHQGKGPFFDAKAEAIKQSATQAEQKAKAQQTYAQTGKLGVDVIGKSTLAPGKWPIDDDITRTIGKNYPAKMEAIGQKWANTLTADERGAIGSYTGAGYDALNSALRAGTAGTVHTKKAQNIATALDKAPKPPPPELVWRGSNVTAAFLQTLAAGDVVALKGFQSTSLNPTTAKSWSGGSTVLEIKPAKGGYVRPISSHKAEYEYLLPHGAKYTLRGVKKIFINDYNKTPITVLQLEMHP